MNAILKDVDWSQVNENFLEAAVAEMEERKRLAAELSEKNDNNKELLYRIWKGAPVSFPRTKHAAKMAYQEVV